MQKARTRPYNGLRRCPVALPDIAFSLRRCRRESHQSHAPMPSGRESAKPTPRGLRLPQTFRMRAAEQRGRSRIASFGERDMGSRNQLCAHYIN